MTTTEQIHDEAGHAVLNPNDVVGDESRSDRSHQGPDAAIALAQRVGQRAAPFAAAHDKDASFVTEGFAAIRNTGYALIGVPRELGGHGHDLEGVCKAQAVLAQYCASTSLAIAMHQHTVLSLAWRWRHHHDQEAARILRRIVAEGLIISISGALSPEAVSVRARPVDGGYRVTGTRGLASGSPGADVLATTVGVLAADGSHAGFVSMLIPLRDSGTRILDDWDSMGMRGSGSNGVRFDDTFVPAENVNGPVLNSGVWKSGFPDRFVGNGAVDEDKPLTALMLPGMNISLTVIAASYLGAATAIRNAAISEIANSPKAKMPSTLHLAGSLIDEVRSGWWTLDGMIRRTHDHTLGTREQMLTTLLGKRRVILSSLRAAELAMEMIGSRSYRRGLPFERAVRDIRAGLTHPVAPDRTLIEIGRTAILAATPKPPDGDHASAESA